MTNRTNSDIYPTTNTYRYSDECIRKVTRIFKWILYLGIGLGLLVGAVGIGGIYSGEPPVWLAVIVWVLLGGGLGIPIFGAAWLGGSAIRKNGGFVGILLILGIIAISVGASVADLTYLLFIGIAVTLIALGILFYMGFKAKVPIWFGLPTLNSPRVYISRGKDDSKTKK